MKRWTLVAAAAVLLAGAGWWLATRDYGPPCGPCPVGVPEPPPGPEAVLAIAAGRDGTEAAVVRAGGRVDFVALSDGKVRGNIDTGAKAWAIRYTHPHDARPAAGPYHDPTTLLAGLPAASVEGRTVAVAGEELREWTGTAPPRVLLRDPRLAGARLLSHLGPGEPVHVALADHRVGCFGLDGRLALSAPLPWRITAMAAAAEGVLAGGEGGDWAWLRADDLAGPRLLPLHGDTPPVTAITVASGDRHAVVAHSLCYPSMQVFEIPPGKGPRRTRLFHGKAPGAVSLAFDPVAGHLYFGKSCGGMGYCPSEGGYHGWPLGGNPQHGLRLFENGTLLLHGWDDGKIVGERVPDGQVVWGERAERIRGTAAGK